jgi:hypothetical protein|tara:strand:- start:259 stop:456 length:198 start_codon:yes stop_codon:yes gene_type:complete
MSNREPMYLKMNRETKQALNKISEYRHSTLANCIEEASKMYIRSESEKIKEELSNLKTLNQMVTV